MSNRLRKFLSYFLMLSMVLSLTAALALVDGAVPAKAAEKTYTFTDRNGKEVTVPVSAFASSVVSFQHGDPWMDDELHMDPSIALGIPDYVEVGSNSTGDLCMGANGVLVLQFDRYITDGEGDDVYVFEVGGYVEETKVEVSNDLKTWYELGYVRGNAAGLDMNGIVPKGSKFKYVRLTDSGNNPNGGWPGADIDTVCGLNTAVIPDEDREEEEYSFTDRQDNEYKVSSKSFASFVVDFTPGDPWMNDDWHMDPSLAVGVPDYEEVGRNSKGDLCMGKGGVITLGFDIYINDGDGNDIYVFEVGGYVEETKVEVSADLKKWYEIGYVRGHEAGLDLNGKVPEGSSFKYVRLTDTGNNPNGDWPGADIDAVCGLHTTTKATTTVKAPGKAKISKLSSKSGKLTVKYKKVSKNRKGYEIQIATEKFFLNPTTKTSTKTKVTFKKLSKGKTYYVRVRAYNKVDGKKVYGEWSAVKSITVK